MKSTFFALTFVFFQAVQTLAGETVIKDSQGMDCHVYTPDNPVAGTAYQLVVGVHGAGGHGKGACGLAGWAQRGDVIAL